MAETEIPTKQWLSVSSAANAAANHLKSLSNQGLMGEAISDIRLEEVELSEDETRWLVTLGFSRPADNQFVSTMVQREYKLFEIDAITGKVKSMKIRTP
jgi:hypothetical protein